MAPQYTVKTPGITSAGTAPAAETGTDAISMGVVTGDVTETCASFRWPTTNDANRNATCTLEYRRDGTTTWLNALDPIWWQNAALGFEGFSGSIFNLAPNTQYDYRITSTDADGGGEQLTSTFVTRNTPRFNRGGTTRSVPDDGTWAQVRDASSAGDIIEIDASESPFAPAFTTSTPAGTNADRILVRPKAGHAVTFTTVFIKEGADWWWFDNFTLRDWVRFELRYQDPTAGTPKNTGTRWTRCDFQGTTSNSIRAFDDMPQIIDCEIHRPNSLDGAALEIDPGQQGGMCAFNYLHTAFDTVSSWSGDDNNRHYNWDFFFNYIQDCIDDCYELDTMFDNIRCCYNLSGPNLESVAISFQPANGPWYICHNQFTGFDETGTNSTTRIYKLSGDDYPVVNIHNTLLVEQSKVKTNAGAMFIRGMIWANNFWHDDEDIDPYILGGAWTNYSGPTLVDYNRYDVSTATVHTGNSLATLQANSVETNTQIITYSDVASPVPDNTPPLPTGLATGQAAAILPITGLSSPGRLEDEGTTAITGYANVALPYVGTNPDIGAWSHDLGAPWFGPRDTTNSAGTEINLAFADVTDTDQWSNWAKELTTVDRSSIGLPAPAAHSAKVRVQLARTTTYTTAWVFDFTRYNEADVWNEYDSFLDVTGGETEVYRFQEGYDENPIREGLAMLVATSGSNHIARIARVEDGGLLRGYGGVSTTDFNANPEVLRDWFKVYSSLYYEHGEVETGDPASSAGAFGPMAMA